MIAGARPTSRSGRFDRSSWFNQQRNAGTTAPKKWKERRSERENAALAKGVCGRETETGEGRGGEETNRAGWGEGKRAPQAAHGGSFGIGIS